MRRYSSGRLANFLIFQTIKPSWWITPVSYTHLDVYKRQEEYIAEKTGKNPMDVAIVFAVVIALVIAVGLFFILPNLITGWITPYVHLSLIHIFGYF